MTIELDADVFDTLELSAWEGGGIGAGSYWDAVGEPLCVIGHAFAATGAKTTAFYPEPETVSALTRSRVHFFDSDNAVRAINARSGNAPSARVPFSAWCKELGIVRKESE